MVPCFLNNDPGKVSLYSRSRCPVSLAHCAQWVVLVEMNNGGGGVVCTGEQMLLMRLSCNAALRVSYDLMCSTASVLPLGVHH